MSLLKKASLCCALALPCLFAGATAVAANIPDYAFATSAVTKNCAEQHAGQAAQVAAGLTFQVVADPSTDGGYMLLATDGKQAQWAPNWNGLKLVYRPGTVMQTVPADFECIPGQESSSSFLAMSGFAQATEPYYEQEHWYGLANLNGQLEHVLIFPRSASTGPTAIVVMESVTAAATVKLDDDGVIHGGHP